MQKLHTVMCFDKNVVVGVLSLLYSIKVNNPQLEVVFHLCALPADLEFFRTRYEHYQTKLDIAEDNLRLHDISTFSMYQKIEAHLAKFLRKGNRNLTVAAFYRLFVFSDLECTPNEHMDRLVYFDTDMICDGDISYLATVELTDKLLGAVPDFEHQLDYARKTLNFQGDNYFNSGLLVVNLQKWQDDNISQKAIDTLIATMPKQLDQDVLNLIAANQVLWLPLGYNSITNILDKPCDNAVVIHYTGARKPWKPWRVVNKATDIYLKYLSAIEPNSELWFDITNANPHALCYPQCVNDMKMIAKHYRKQGQYLKAWQAWWKHLVLKVKQKGILFALLGK